MKILLLSDAFYGGGAERSARELMELLQARGESVEMLVASARPDYPAGVRVARAPWEKYLKVFKFLGGGVDWDPRHVGTARILSRVQRGDYDIVHAHNILSGWMNLRALRALARRVPLVWTFHDERPIGYASGYDLSRVMSREEIFKHCPEPHWAAQMDGSGPLAARCRAYFEPRAPRPSAIVTPSTYLARMARESKLYADVPVEVVPYGLPFLRVPETQQPRDEARRALNVAPDAKVVLLLAAALDSTFKGIWLGVEALARLRNERDDLHVLIAGGKAEPLIAQLAAANPNLRATNLGYLKSSAELARAYRASDVTLLPSVADNYPYVALESFACETPITAFAVDGFPDLVGNNERGSLATPVTGDALAASLQSLLSDDARRTAAGAAARRWVLETSDVNRWIDRHLDIYQAARERLAATRTTGAPS